MNAVNPRFVLRNHLAQEAIEGVEKRRDNTEARMLLKLLESPFSDRGLAEILGGFRSEVEQGDLAGEKNVFDLFVFWGVGYRKFFGFFQKYGFSRTIFLERSRSLNFFENFAEKKKYFFFIY